MAWRAAIWRGGMVFFDWGLFILNFHRLTNIPKYLYWLYNLTKAFLYRPHFFLSQTSFFINLQHYVSAFLFFVLIIKSFIDNIIIMCPLSSPTYVFQILPIFCLWIPNVPQLYPKYKTIHLQCNTYVYISRMVLFICFVMYLELRLYS